jgi:1-acyl-sn-glycerol-3-phosphate acyltransferase
MVRLLARFIFWMAGWKAVGEIPPIKKFVVITAPHTSMWDIVYNLCAQQILNTKFSLLMKRELFGFPLGPVLKYFGGIPVDRSSAHNMVEQAVQMFNEREEFILAIAPEGTRKRVAKFKTGFYYIAVQAGVPILLSYLDFEKKVVGIGPVFYPTGDADKDIEEITNFYRPIKGRHPEKGVF